LPACESVVDGDVLPFDITELTQPLPEGVDFCRGSGSAVKQESDPGDLPRLILPFRSERRSEETESENDREPISRMDTSG
jgi:hypothetical protein